MTEASTTAAPDASAASTSKMTMVEAINLALHEAMEADSKVLVLGEEVGGFADRSDDVGGLQAGKVELLSTLRRLVLIGDRCRPDEVERPIQRGADQRVHAGVADDELLDARLLDVFDP